MIRIIGDRLSGEIKAALLHTIGLLIAKAGPGLKPFVPQLQTTFLKCLGDQVAAHINSFVHVILVRHRLADEGFRSQSQQILHIC